MPKKYLVEEPDDSNWDLNQERAFWERMLNQKINFFLAFFVILIIGAAVANTKELALFILSVGAIILWILAVSIINTTRKINLAVKELSKSANHPTGMVDKKAKGRTVRLVLGFGLPIFCASIITLIYLAGLSGLYSFHFPSKPEVVQSAQTIIERGKESIVDKKPPVKENASHFENVDSIIQKNKFVRVNVPKDSTNRFAAKPQVVPAQPKVNPNFKSLDKVISSEEVYSNPNKPTKSVLKDEKPHQPQVVPAQAKINPNFKGIEQVVSNSGATSSVAKQSNGLLKKEEAAKQLPPNPNFKSIDQVITKDENNNPPVSTLKKLIKKVKQKPAQKENPSSMKIEN